MKAWTYVLKCSDASYYIGSTKDLKRRIHEHEKGFCWYTSRRRPVEVVYSEIHKSIIFAKKREMQIKGWTKRKKEALIKSDSNSLHEFSKCKNQSSHFNKRPSAPLRTADFKRK